MTNFGNHRWAGGGAALCAAACFLLLPSPPTLNFTPDAAPRSNVSHVPTACSTSMHQTPKRFYLIKRPVCSGVCIVSSPAHLQSKHLRLQGRIQHRRSRPFHFHQELRLHVDGIFFFSSIGQSAATGTVSRAAAEARRSSWPMDSSIFHPYSYATRTGSEVVD